MRRKGKGTLKYKTIFKEDFGPKLILKFGNNNNTLADRTDILCVTETNFCKDLKECIFD